MQKGLTVIRREFPRIALFQAGYRMSGLKNKCLDTLLILQTFSPVANIGGGISSPHHFGPTQLTMCGHEALLLSKTSLYIES